MKIRALLLVAGIALVPLASTGAAVAQDLPDLPGMGAASKLVAGQDPAASGQTSSSGSGQAASAATADTAVAGSSDTGASAASLPDLPGTGAISVFEAEKAKASLPRAGAGLEAWAALGSVAAIGGLYALRRFGAL